jgi:chemotaxis family two-component system sensor kinase Cph1
MKMQTKTKEQLANELEKMRQRVAELEQVDAERKRVEEALRDSEEKLRVTFESISDAVAVIDLEGRFVQVNEAAARMSGYTKEELVGRNVLDTIIAEKDRDKIVTDMAKTLEKGQAMGIRAYTLVARDGREFDTEFSTSVLRDSSGNVVNLVGVARDITERKRAEKERERLLAELEDKSKEMKQLLFVASHDLRSPLVNIQGFTREIEHSLQQVHSLLESEDIPPALKEKLAAPIEEGIADSLSYILASTSKIDTLLKGLLKLSRLGQVAITIEKLNMSELMAEVVDSFEFQIKEAGVKLEVAKLPQCQGDKAQINQVFSNLIGNALKYLDPERPGIIRISGSTEDTKAVYTVEDNGIGIAPEHQETVFQIFQRVDPKASSGEGLGLTIVRRILDRHGGKVWLESEPGRGSRFHVSLPIGD